jgi:SP family sugar porter-like MFS transporter
MQQLAIVIGILAAQIINWQIADPVPKVHQLRALCSSDRQPRSERGDASTAPPQTDADQAFADPAALAEVRRRFPQLSSAPAEEPASDDEKEARKWEDQQVMDTYLLATWNGQQGWRWMFAAEVVFSCVFFALMFFVPESPRWLVKYGRDAEAESILTRVGGLRYAQAAVADVRKTLDQEEIARVRFADLLEPGLRKVIALGVFLAVFQQWCGINVIFNYAQEVFTAAGYGVSDIMFNIVVTGIVNLVFTLVAIHSVDRIGRRALMLVGFGGLAVIYAVFGAGFLRQSTGTYMLALVVTAIACYAMSLAPVTWVLISEIFPNRIRGAAMSIAVFSLWVACIILVATFPYLNKWLRASGTFWLYGAICVLGFVVVWLKLPETKGKSLEQIERELVA